MEGATGSSKAELACSEDMGDGREIIPSIEEGAQAAFDVIGMVERDRGTAGAISPEEIMLLCEACMFGRQPLLAELVQRNEQSGTGIDRSAADVFVQLCGAGHVRSAEYFLRYCGGCCKQIGSVDAWRALEAACASGSMAVVQLVRERLGQLLCFISEADDPAARGRAVAAARTVEIAEIITATYGVTANEMRMANALGAVCSRCDIAMYRWIVERFELTKCDIFDARSGLFKSIGADPRATASDIIAMLTVFAEKNAITPVKLTSVALREYERGHADAVEWLLERYPVAFHVYPYTFLCAACERGDVAIVEKISRYINKRMQVFSCDDVLESCVRGGRDVVGYALRKLADSTAETDMRRFAYMFRALGVIGDVQYYVDVIQMLCDLVSVQTEQAASYVLSWTLPYACEYGHTALVHHILEAWNPRIARVHVVIGMTAALCGGHVDLAAELCEMHGIVRDEAVGDIEELKSDALVWNYVHVDAQRLANAAPFHHHNVITPFHRVAISGNSAGLAWLYDRFDVVLSEPATFTHGGIFVLACRGAGLEAAMWLAKRCAFDTHIAVSAITAACAMRHSSRPNTNAGFLLLVRWDSAKAIPKEEMIQEGEEEEKDRLRLAKWIRTEFGLTGPDIFSRDVTLFGACAANRYERIFRWAVETFQPSANEFVHGAGDNHHSPVLGKVVVCGSIGLLRWFFDTININRGHILRYSFFISEVFGKGDLEKLTMLAARFSLTPGELIESCEPSFSTSVAYGEYYVVSGWFRSLIVMNARK